MPVQQPEKSTNSEIPQSPTSQIPGLGDCANAHNEGMFGSRRKWIRDTDSAYVRLAKQGGRPDLLKHYAPVTPVTKKSTPVAYAAPDWYVHHSSPPANKEPRKDVSSLPDYMIHKEFNVADHASSNYETRRGPFDFDMKSVWQRDAEDKENTEKKTVKLPAINAKYPSKTANVSMNKEFSGKNKISFPPMPAQRKGEPVNFSKLISNGYGTDWFQQHTRCGKKIQDAPKDTEQTQDSEPSQSESAPASDESKP
ncbi:uncharacterized protein C7orf57 homolog [Coturnix japonica]|uniref:Chromosome 7 open reading frame 57 n=1 Tax=Coturnix japonica TaxID=93934 RepID=A0A8C2TW21_COTJA|nr:uncharacterized protein C7orf57 homolog [Coturnix japonica]XP_015709870.1 uncharacterized protein C7orf57 homolog [Coturnix japonica]XP_015709871.1 uncharacterized protein C7orf57 homolog [Coturnix japonica]XP_015709872.1 uncharacterized protein C7orf57 homolog [Coturnix japonica]